MHSTSGRISKWLVITLAGVSVIAAAVVVYLAVWDRYIEAGLGRWAVAEVAQRSRGAYRLVLGDLDFRPLAGSMSFDSAVVSTDTALNRTLDAPAPVLSARAVGCRLSDVSVVRLMLLKRFEAGAMGCEGVFTAIELPPLAGGGARDAPRDSATSATDTGPRVIRPPLGIRTFQVSNIAFPTLQFSMRRLGVRGQASLEIAHARFVANVVEFDPTAPPGSPQAFASTGLRLAGSNLRYKPDALNEVTLAGIDFGISDSTFSLSHLTLGPTVADEQWRQHQQVRRDRIRVALDTLAAEGVQYRTLVRTGNVFARRLMLHGARLDVLSDKRLPAGPKKTHTTPQRSARNTEVAVRIDTVVVDSSELSYLERRPKRDRPGRLDFRALSAQINNLHMPSSGAPLTISLSALLMGEGNLAVKAAVPLDAADFRFTLTGRLGLMPAAALNQFLAETEPVELKSGQIDSVLFVMKVAQGVSETVLTPHYRSLGIDVTNPQGNVRGFIKAGLIEFGANKLKVRSSNPGSPGQPARSARVSRRYERTQSWISFLWLSIRDGLLEVVVK
jgi:hypothetical protein